MKIVVLPIFLKYFISAFFFPQEYELPWLASRHLVGIYVIIIK